MKKFLITFIVVTIIIAIFSTTFNNVSAFDFKQSLTQMSDSADDQSGAKDAATNITGAILTVFRIVAVGIALIMIVVVAIKYMSAAPEGKAEIKKHAVIYIVGAIVLFASSGILGIIQNFASTNISG